MKNYLVFFMMLLLLSSCLKDNDTKPEPTIDRENFAYVLNWTETESKTGNQNWESITDRQKLSFFSNYVDEVLNLPNNGKILYQPSVNTGIKNESYFERTDSTFIIYSSSLPEETDTLVVNYALANDSTLILVDTSVSPVIEIKYKREN